MPSPPSSSAEPTCSAAPAGMIGTVAGAVMLGALANILQLNDVSAAMQLLATGGIIVLAAALQTFVGRDASTR